VVRTSFHKDEGCPGLENPNNFRQKPCPGPASGHPSQAIQADNGIHTAACLHCTRLNVIYMDYNAIHTVACLLSSPLVVIYMDYNKIYTAACVHATPLLVICMDNNGIHTSAFLYWTNRIKPGH
jgi:hypothetical protein